MAQAFAPEPIPLRHIRRLLIEEGLAVP
jgi:hypothetical protein